ncbi:unnamed protein product [Tuber aestivum]|uniref:Uncharacterized protein n=1 Tax=Tuber aestivum TaxID=59557 RepID=A0A292Q0B0_9PEZI|nr:unnamed protein product [Tuber aestivum]
MLTPSGTSPSPTPSLTSAPSPPTNLLEHNSATSAMGVNPGFYDSQSGTDSTDGGVSGPEMLQKRDSARIGPFVVSGFDLSQYLQYTPTAELSPLERFRREPAEENRIPGLVQFCIPPIAAFESCELRGTTGEGSRGREVRNDRYLRRVRRRRARRRRALELRAPPPPHPNHYQLGIGLRET